MSVGPQVTIIKGRERMEGYTWEGATRLLAREVRRTRDQLLIERVRVSPLVFASMETALILLLR